MPNHSRTSSSASSVGSSYVSSTDSNKTSNIESPTPLILNDTPTTNNFEATNNYLNTNFHSAPLTDSATLPRYQDTYNVLISELNEVNEQVNLNSRKPQEDDKTDHSNRSDDIIFYKESTDQLDANRTEPIYDNNETNEFTYKTLNGGIIRSVHPPGKGNSACYKV